MERKQIGYLHGTRVIGALAVVLLHTVSSALTNASFPVEEEVAAACQLVHVGMNFAVPLFLMGTGVLFLNNDTVYTYTAMRKYVGRVARCLLLFGMLFSLLEQFFTRRYVSADMLSIALRDVLTGNLWDHMWYLYMLLGVYLLMPVLKAFWTGAVARDRGILLALLFLLRSLLPALGRHWNMEIAISIPIDSLYVFYVLVGAWLDRLPCTRVQTVVAGCTAVASACLLGLASLGRLPLDTGNESVFVCLWAMSLFLLSKRVFSQPVGRGWLWFSRVSFGVYLIHPLVINVLMKVLHVQPLAFLPWLSVPVFGVGVFAVSAAVTWLLRKVAFVRKYIL